MELFGIAYNYVRFSFGNHCFPKSFDALVDGVTKIYIVE
jgi:hypothetical protein